MKQPIITKSITTFYTLLVAALASLIPSAGISQARSGAAQKARIRWNNETRHYATPRTAFEAQQAALAWASKMPRLGGKSGSGPGIMSVGAMALPGPAVPQALPTNSTWNFIGPVDTTERNLFGFGPGAVSGRVNAVTFDKLNQNIYYLASASGGVWKSVDKGVHWAPLALANPYGYSFSSVAVDPVDDRIVYAGSGDYDGYDNPGFGVIKFTFTSNTSTTSYTVDAAVQANSFAQTQFACIRGLAIDPLNHNHVLVASGRDGNDPPDGAIYQSFDGGHTYSNATSAIGGLFFSNIVYANNQVGATTANEVIYASADYGGVYKSTNDGASWSRLASLNLLNNKGGGTNRVDVAASLLNTGTVYAASEFTESIYKSTDAGATWSVISNSFPTTDPTGGGTWDQAWYDFHLHTASATTSPNGAFGQPGSTNSTDVVYFGLLDVYQSPTGGDNWVPILNTYSGNDLAHTDQHGMAISPFNPNLSLIGNDGGVYQLVYSPGISNYNLTSLNATLGITQIYSMSAGFTDTLQALLGTQDNSHPHLDENLNHWVDADTGDGSYAAINPQLFGTQFAAVQFDYTGSLLTFTEDDWNQTFGAVGIPADPPADLNPLFIPPIVMDRYNADLMYVGQQYVWQGVHTPGTPATLGNPPVIGTVVFNQFGAILTDPDPNNVDDVITAVGVSSYDNRWLYAGTNHGLFWFANNGSNWLRQDGFNFTDATGNVFFIHNNGIPPNGEFTAFASSNKHPKTLFGGYVQATKNGLVYSMQMCKDVTAGFINGQGVWQPTCKFVNISGSGAGALPNAAINSITMIPHDTDQVIVVGTDVGVFLTTNGGSSWFNIGEDGVFPAGLRITQVRYEPSTSYLYAGTYGRGLWAKYVPADPSVASIFQTGISIYPNLQMYRGNRAKLAVTMKYYAAGQPINGTAPPNAAPIPTPVEMVSSTLSASGWLQNSVSVNGAFDIWFKINGFLSLRLTNAQINNNSLVTPLVYAGDCNPIFDANGVEIGHGDNVIDINDFNAVLNHMGQFWTGPEDVDGDGVVTARDLSIVQSNMGRRGQP